MLGYTLCMVAAGRKKELSPTMIVLTGVFIAYFILDCIFKERGKRMLTERQKRLFREIPKAENHIHIEGSIPWDLCFTVSREKSC